MAEPTRARETGPVFVSRSFRRRLPHPPPHRLSFSTSALAADYVCKGDRVEKGGSTKYTIRTSGSDYTIEKGGSSKGKAVKRGSNYAVEIGGSTQATIENGTIYKGGSTWKKVDDAQRVFDCPDVIAATLWVLTEKGAL